MADEKHRADETYPASSDALVTELEQIKDEAGFNALLMHLVREPIPVVIGFYEEADEDWPKSKVARTLQDVAEEFTGRCQFMVCNADRSVLSHEYEDWCGFGYKFDTLPMFAMFFRGGVVSACGCVEDEVGSSDIHGLIEKGLAEFANPLTAIAWLHTPDVPRRLLPILPKDGLIGLAQDAITSCEAVATSSHERFEKHIQEWLDLPPTTAVACIYAPHNAPFWINEIPFPVEPGREVRMRLAFDLEDIDEQTSIVQVLDEDESGNGPWLVPSSIEWDKFLIFFRAAICSGTILLCTSNDEWMQLRSASPLFRTVDYVYFVDSGDSMLNWISEHLPVPPTWDERLYEWDIFVYFAESRWYEEGAGFIPSSFPMVINLRASNWDGETVIKDCAATGYRMRSSEGETLSEVEEIASHWAGRRLSRLHASLSEFIESAVYGVPDEFKRLLGEFCDGMRTTGTLGEYESRYHQSVSGEYDEEMRAAESPEYLNKQYASIKKRILREDERRLVEQAKRNFLVSWNWPKASSPTLNLAHSIRMLKRMHTRQ